jgi:hypothetical protein
MARIMITLQQNEREALRELAQRERRDPRDQAALFVRDGLQRVGLLPVDQPTPIVDGFGRVIGGSNGDQ